MVNHVLLLGTRDGAPWHPLGAIEADLRACLEGLGSFEVTGEAEHLEELGGVSLLVCCADLWERTLTDEETGGLLRFVAGGGGLLVLHNGICFQKRPSFRPWWGRSSRGTPTQAPWNSGLRPPATRSAPLQRGGPCPTSPTGSK